MKVESSPKPKRKFRVPKPNIGKNIKQKIRSRLKKGTIANESKSLCWLCKYNWVML